jgi:hypothetical protein
MGHPNVSSHLLSRKLNSTLHTYTMVLESEIFYQNILTCERQSNGSMETSYIEVLNNHNIHFILIHCAVIIDFL